MKSNDVLYRHINSRRNHLMMTSKMNILDDVGSLCNLTGDYYPITPINKNVLRAAESVSALTKVWKNVYNDLGKSVSMFFPNSKVYLKSYESQIYLPK